MRAIGLTGGVGSGKSEILKYLEKEYHARVLRADEMAHRLIEKGNICYGAIVELMGEDILNEDKSINRCKMADKMFGNDALRARVNQIIHPAVKDATIMELEMASAGGVSCLVFEAALIIEEDYGQLLDEIWYVYASIETRARRLRETRGYSDEKIRSIMASQCSEEDFEDYCDILIDNDGDLEETYKQIDMLMRQ